MKSKSKKPSNIGGFISVDFDTCSEIDYMDKLSEEERRWYERFLDNEYNARIHKDGKDVVIDREQQKAANRHKQRRLKDVTNKYSKSDAEQSESPKGTFSPFGHQFLDVKPERQRTKHWKSKAKPSRKKVKSATNSTLFESLEEFVKRGGKVLKAK